MRVLSLSFLVLFLSGCGQAVFSGDGSASSEKGLSVQAGNELAAALLQDPQLCEKNGLVPKKDDCDSDSNSTDDLTAPGASTPATTAAVDDDSSDDSSSDDDVVCTDLATCLKAKCEAPATEPQQPAQPAAPAP